MLLVLGRYADGDVRLHDHLDAELVVETSFVSGRQSLVLTPEDLDHWAACLDALAQGVDEVRWLDDGRSPGLSILRSKAPDVLDGPDGEEAAIQVTVHNAAADVLVSAWLMPMLGWVRDLKGLLGQRADHLAARDQRVLAPHLPLALAHPRDELLMWSA